MRWCPFLVTFVPRPILIGLTIRTRQMWDCSDVAVLVVFRYTLALTDSSPTYNGNSNASGTRPVRMPLNHTKCCSKAHNNASLLEKQTKGIWTSMHIYKGDAPNKAQYNSFFRSSPLFSSWVRAPPLCLVTAQIPERNEVKAQLYKGAPIYKGVPQIYLLHLFLRPIITLKVSYHYAKLKRIERVWDFQVSLLKIQIEDIKLTIFFHGPSALPSSPSVSRRKAPEDFCGLLASCETLVEGVWTLDKVVHMPQDRDILFIVWRRRQEYSKLCYSPMNEWHTFEAMREWKRTLVQCQAWYFSILISEKCFSKAELESKIQPFLSQDGGRHLLAPSMLKEGKRIVAGDSECVMESWMRRSSISLQSSA